MNKPPAIENVKLNRDLLFEDLDKSESGTKFILHTRLGNISRQKISKSGQIVARNNLAFNVNKDPEEMPHYKPYSGLERLPNEDLGEAKDIHIEEEEEEEI